MRRPDATLAVADHNVPTTDRSHGIADDESRIQVETLEKNCARVRRRLLLDGRHPPGHRPHHRAGAGLDPAGHDHRVRRQPHRDARRVRRARLRHRHLRGRARAGDADAAAEPGQEHARLASRATLPLGVTAKDLILAIIGTIGTAGGTGYVIEYAGEAIRALSMEGRMTVCNMSIEAGARAGLIAPDETTFEYLKGRPMAPKGAAWEQAVAYWRTLPDEGATYDKEVCSKRRRSRRR